MTERIHGESETSIFKINDKELSCAIREPEDITNTQLLKIIIDILENKKEALKTAKKLLRTQGYTEYNVKRGDIMRDEYGRTFKIKKVSTYTTDNQFIYNQLDLEKIN